MSQFLRNYVCTNCWLYISLKLPINVQKLNEHDLNAIVYNHTHIHTRTYTRTYTRMVIHVLLLYVYKAVIFSSMSGCLESCDALDPFSCLLLRKLVEVPFLDFFGLRYLKSCLSWLQQRHDRGNKIFLKAFRNSELKML